MMLDYGAKVYCLTLIQWNLSSIMVILGKKILDQEKTCCKYNPNVLSIKFLTCGGGAVRNQLSEYIGWGWGWGEGNKHI